MRAIFEILSSAAAAWAVISTAPAHAQYADPRTGDRQRENTQTLVNRCADAAQARIGRNRDGNNNALDGYSARVLGISSVRPQSGGSLLTVSGVATSGRYASIADGVRRPVDLTWRCTSDYFGTIEKLDISPALPTNSAGDEASTGSYQGQDYSRYGYRRY